LRDGVAVGFVAATFRLGAEGFAAAVVFGTSSAERSTQPIRVTRTHPFGAELVSMSTAVPASSDATLFADALPFDLTTTERFPMRVVLEDFCAEIRVRSTYPPTETRAYAPFVASTRSSTPGRTLPIAFPVGVDITASGVFTTPVWAEDSDGTSANTISARNVRDATGDNGGDRCIAGWSMCALIHSTRGACSRWLP
jgi:hypothetical protein